MALVRKILLSKFAFVQMVLDREVIAMTMTHHILRNDEEYDGIDNIAMVKSMNQVQTFEYDFDGDGFGSNENILQSCIQPRIHRKVRLR